MINLDFLCMETAQQMVACKGKPSDKENVATKALGVLLDNGPYGLMLYLETQSNTRDIAKHYQRSLLTLCAESTIVKYLTSNEPPNGANFDDVTKWLRSLAQDLDSYLFAKQLWQQTLTYARYHAKAIEEPTGSTQVDDQEST